VLKERKELKVLVISIQVPQVLQVDKVLKVLKVQLVLKDHLQTKD
jgi:hypothetical protein